jgi:hypothetical protein
MDLSAGPNYVVELRPKMLDRCARVRAQVIGDVLGNGHRPFGLVHGLRPRRLFGIFEIGQCLSNPKQLAAVRKASGALKSIQKAADPISDVTVHRCARANVEGHGGLDIPENPDLASHFAYSDPNNKTLKFPHFRS